VIGELIVLFGVMLTGLFIGVPVFLSMAAAGAAYTIVFWPKVPTAIVAQGFVQGLDSYNFTAIVFFFLVGEVMNQGGISQRLLRFARALVGHVRGGLSHVNILASMVFAGVSGSAAADAAAIGSVMIPAMKKEGYPPGYAAAVTAASATIGPIIPPSIPLVVFGLFALTSIGKLFLGGVIPGVLMGVFLLVASYIISRRRNYPASDWAGWSEIFSAAGSSLLALVMPVLVVFGLVSGVATVTEIGAIAAVYAIIVSMLVYRELSLSGLWGAIIKAGADATKVLAIISIAGLFIWIVANMGLARAIATWIGGQTGDPLLVLAIFAAVLLIAGTILEPVTILVVIVPLMIPTANSVGIDLTQFGVVAVLATLIGLVTPPVGFLIYLTGAQAEASVISVIRELVPFIFALLLLLAAIIIFPPLTTYLPNLLLG